MLVKPGEAPVRLTWEEWQASRPAKRAALARRGCSAPSRRSESYDAAERWMRAAFGGGRVPPGVKSGCELETEMAK